MKIKFFFLFLICELKNCLIFGYAKASNDGIQSPALPGFPPAAPTVAPGFVPPMIPTAPFIPPPGLPPGPPGIMPPQFSIPPPGFGFPIAGAPPMEPGVIGIDSFFILHFLEVSQIYSTLLIFTRRRVCIKTSR